MLLQNLHINLTLSFGLFFRPLAHCPPPVAFTLPRTSFSLASHTSLASCVLWDNVLCHLLESNIDTELGKKPFIFENKTQNQRFNVIGYAGSGNTSIIRYHYQHVLPHVLP